MKTLLTEEHNISSDNFDEFFDKLKSRKSYIQ